MTEYAIALMLPPEHARWVLNARIQVLGEDRPYTAHITVKSPFVVDDDPSFVFATIAAIAGRHETFSVEAGGLQHFGGPVQNVVYVPVSATPDLIELHRDLVTGIAGMTHPSRPYGSTLELDGYIPHVTIAGNLTDEQLAAGLAALSGSEPAFSFICTHVTLASSEDGHVWTLLADYPLVHAPRTPHFVAHDTAIFSRTLELAKQLSYNVLTEGQV